MSIFEPEKVLKMSEEKEVKIINYIGSGHRHHVYSVEYSGETKALVMYKDVLSSELREKKIEKLKKHIDMETPNIAFLWPIEIVDLGEDGLGYIVDMRRSEYISVAFILENNVKFLSGQGVVDACMRIANAINSLNEHGFSYENLNLKNIFIDPSNGDVLINYLDNIVDEGTMPLSGTLEFTAPELCSVERKPLSAYTDVYSLSIIVFMLLFNHHPYEGTKWLEPFLTDAIKREIYIDSPVFIFDENDTSNPPSPYVQKQVSEVWRSMPLYAQSFFKEAFSTESIQKPKNRAGVIEWLVLLSRLRSDIVKCGCGNEVIVKNNSSADCKKCGHAINIEFVIAMPDFRITVHRGTRIYKCLLGKTSSKEAIEPAFVVAPRADAPNVFGLKNVTKETIVARTPSGSEKTVEQQALIPFMDGIDMTVYDTVISIKKKS